jgi:membrane-bound ClpP family serine protease
MLRTFAFIIIGVVIGLLSVVFSVAYLPPDYTFLSMILVSITMWNLGIYLILGFQYIVSIIIVWSMLKVAYIYDNQSWEYVHSLTNAGNAIGTQLDTDKLTKKELDKKHTEMLNEKIGKLKDN